MFRVFFNGLSISDIYALSFFYYRSFDHRDLHSFPTRRSSDLCVVLVCVVCVCVCLCVCVCVLCVCCAGAQTSEVQSRVDISYVVLCLKKDVVVG